MANALTEAFRSAVEVGQHLVQSFGLDDMGRSAKAVEINALAALGHEDFPRAGDDRWAAVEVIGVSDNRAGGFGVAGLHGHLQYRVGVEGRYWGQKSLSRRKGINVPNKGCFGKLHYAIQPPPARQRAKKNPPLGRVLVGWRGRIMRRYPAFSSACNLS